MKVLHLVYDLEPGGYQSLLLGLLPELKKTGVDCHIMSLRPHLSLKNRFQKEGIPVSDLRKNLGIDFPAYGRLRHILRHEGYDLLHCHSSSAGLWGRLACIGNHSPPVIMSVHEEAGWDQPRRRKFTNQLLKPWTHRWVGVSQCVKTSLIEREGLPADKIEFIPNGIPLDQFQRHHERSAAREKLGLLNDRILIGMIGRCRHEKGGDLFLSAMHVLREQRGDVVPVLVGDGADRSDWIAISDTLGLPTIAPGAVPDPRTWIEALDLLVVPSRQESAGIIALEAAALECPVVAFAVGGIPEYLRDKTDALLVEPHNVASLANACLASLQNPYETKTRVTSARQRVQDHFNLSTIAEAWTHLYLGTAES